MLIYINADFRTKLFRQDIAGALEDCRVTLGLTNHLEASTSSVGIWTFLTGIRSALGGIWRIMLVRPHDLNLLDLLDQLVRDVKIPDFYEVMGAEFAKGRQTVEEVKNLRDVGLDRTLPDSFSTAMDRLYQTPGVKQAFEAKYVQYYVKLFESLPANHEDWAGIQSAIKKIDKEIARDPNLDAAMARALGVGSPIVPLNLGILQIEKRIWAEGIAALKLKATTGMYPMSLPIKGEESMDPFWGKPLHYQLQSDGFTISSEGRDFGSESPFSLKRGSAYRFREGWEPRRPGFAY
jgi:hypothetical protein